MALLGCQHFSLTGDHIRADAVVADCAIITFVSAPFFRVSWSLCGDLSGRQAAIDCRFVHAERFGHLRRRESAHSWRAGELLEGQGKGQGGEGEGYLFSGRIVRRSEVTHSQYELRRVAISFLWHCIPCGYGDAFCKPCDGFWSPT